MEVLQKSSSALRQSFETQQLQQQPMELYKTATFFEPIHPSSQQLLSHKQQAQSHKQLPFNSINNHELLHISLPHNSWDTETKQILSSRVRYQPQEAGLLTPSMIPKASYNSPQNLSRANINCATLPQRNPSFSQASSQLNSFSVRKRPVLAFKLNQPNQPSNNEPQEQIPGDAEFWSKVNTILNDADENTNQNQMLQNHLQQTKSQRQQQQTITLPSIINNNSSFNQIGNKSNTVCQPERAKSKNDSKLLTQQSETQLNSFNPLHCQNSKSPSLNIDLSQSSCSTRDSLRQHSSPHHSMEFNTVQHNQPLPQQHQLFHLFPFTATDIQQSSSTSQLNFQRIQPYFSGSQSLKNSGKNMSLPKRISRANEKLNDENGGNYSANQLTNQMQSMINQSEGKSSNSMKRIGQEENYYAKKNDYNKDMFQSLVSTPSIKRISLLSSEENMRIRGQQTKIPKVASAPASNTDLCNNYLCTAPDVFQEHWNDNKNQDSNKNNHEFSFCNENNNNIITNNTSNSSKNIISSNSNTGSASKTISQSAQGYRGQIKKTSLLSRQQDNLVKKLFKIDDKQGNEAIDNNYMQFAGSSQDFRNYQTFKAIYIGSSNGNRISTKNN